MPKAAQPIKVNNAATAQLTTTQMYYQRHEKKNASRAQDHTPYKCQGRRDLGSFMTRTPQLGSTSMSCGPSSLNWFLFRTRSETGSLFGDQYEGSHSYGIWYLPLIRPTLVQRLVTALYRAAVLSKIMEICLKGGIKIRLDMITISLSPSWRSCPTPRALNTAPTSAAISALGWLGFVSAGQRKSMKREATSRSTDRSRQ